MAAARLSGGSLPRLRGLEDFKIARRQTTKYEIRKSKVNTADKSPCCLFLELIVIGKGDSFQDPRPFELQVYGDDLVASPAR